MTIEALEEKRGGRMRERIPEQPNVPPFSKLNTNEGFSATFDVSPESMEKLKKICGEISVFTADQIGYVNKETGERAEFVSKRKLNEVISKMQELSSKMEELGKNGNSFAEYADECIEILRDSMK